MNDLNFAALAIAVLSERPCTPERAFEMLHIETLHRKNGPVFSKDEFDKDTQDMMKLNKEGVPYSELAYMYGTSVSAISHRIKRYRCKRIGVS